MSSYQYEKKFDVVILGAGVIGCSIAYYLLKESQGKLKVAVVERNHVGSETSSGAAGMLAAQVETEFPGPFLDLAAPSRDSFPALARELLEISGRDIEYAPSGILEVAWSKVSANALQERCRRQQAAGFEGEFLSGEQVRAHFPYLRGDLAGGFFVPKDGQVSAPSLTAAFAESAKKLGALFFEDESWEGTLPPGPRFASLETNVSKFQADRFVFAAGPWTGKLLHSLVPGNPIKGQILQLDVPKSWAASARWTSPIYCGPLPSGSGSLYFVPKKDGSFLLGATMENSGFDRSENASATQELHRYAVQIAPDLAPFPVKSVWVGLRPGSPDGLPLLGLVPGYDNLYAACGHLRNGILLAPITGKLMAQLLLGRKTELSLEPFSPSRFAK